jgi:hypothetical protein
LGLDFLKVLSILLRSQTKSGIFQFSLVKTKLLSGSSSKKPIIIGKEDSNGRPWRMMMANFPVDGQHDIILEKESAAHVRYGKSRCLLLPATIRWCNSIVRIPGKNPYQLWSTILAYVAVVFNVLKVL